MQENLINLLRDKRSCETIAKSNKIQDEIITDLNEILCQDVTNKICEFIDFTEEYRDLVKNSLNFVKTHNKSLIWWDKKDVGTTRNVSKQQDHYTPEEIFEVEVIETLCNPKKLETAMGACKVLTYLENKLTRIVKIMKYIRYMKNNYYDLFEDFEYHWNITQKEDRENVIKIIAPSSSTACTDPMACKIGDCENQRCTDKIRGYTSDIINDKSFNEVINCITDFFIVDDCTAGKSFISGLKLYSINFSLKMNSNSCKISKIKITDKMVRNNRFVRVYVDDILIDLYKPEIMENKEYDILRIIIYLINDYEDFRGPYSDLFYHDNI